MRHILNKHYLQDNLYSWKAIVEISDYLHKNNYESLVDIKNSPSLEGGTCIIAAKKPIEKVKFIKFHFSYEEE